MNNIVLTGGLGFLGSDILVKLARRGHQLCVIDKRTPSGLLSNIISSSDNVNFYQSCLTNSTSVNNIIDKHVNKTGNIDFMVHLGDSWSYDMKDCHKLMKTNQETMKNIINVSVKSKVKRIIYSSTIICVPFHETITENTPILKEQNHPYGMSKILCERSLMEMSNSNPKISTSVVRATGVYDDYNNLPPLDWTINRWSNNSFESNIVPGKGTTGMPYLHRDDFTKLIKSIMDNHDELDKDNVFLASVDGTVSHNDMFGTVSELVKGVKKIPIHVPLPVVKLGMIKERIFYRLGFGPEPKEQDWMFDFIDNPIVIDSSRTQGILNWLPSDKSDIIKHLPTIIKNKIDDGTFYKMAQNKRENHMYEYFYKKRG